MTEEVAEQGCSKSTDLCHSHSSVTVIHKREAWARLSSCPLTEPCDQDPNPLVYPPDDTTQWYLCPYKEHNLVRPQHQLTFGTLAVLLSYRKYSRYKLLKAGDINLRSTFVYSRKRSICIWRQFSFKSRVYTHSINNSLFISGVSFNVVNVNTRITSINQSP